MNHMIMKKKNHLSICLFSSVVKYKGKMDKQGKYHGDGEAWYYFDTKIT